MVNSNLNERVELEARPIDGTLTFKYPPFGPGTYHSIGNEIEQSGLRRVTMAETISIGYDILKQNSRHSEEIKERFIEILKESRFYAFTEVIGIPEIDGLYLNDAHTKADEIDINNPDLEKILRENQKVRFVSLNDFKQGEQTLVELARHKFVIAQAGEEEAEKLAEIASILKKASYVITLAKVYRPTKTVSALDSYCGFDGRLCVSGYRNYGRGGFALGRGLEK
ncbi:hypothetical protein HYX16_06080 [Candidatus Woesearchaeota archaeon]|nr:hypothetical protein [Candidatus Woesearchaeota archaeon]